jgi:acetylornithine/succinyldiaminopimelate/putrescine aminotransferase
MDRGVLINATHDTVIRLLPALNISADDVDRGCETVCDVIKELAAA